MKMETVSRSTRRVSEVVLDKNEAVTADGDNKNVAIDIVSGDKNALASTTRLTTVDSELFSMDSIFIDNVDKNDTAQYDVYSNTDQILTRTENPIYSMATTKKLNESK